MAVQSRRVKLITRYSVVKGVRCGPYCAGHRLRSSNSPLGFHHPELAFCSDNKAAMPFADVFTLKQRTEALYQCTSTWRTKTDEQDTAVRSRSKLPLVREVQVLIGRAELPELANPLQRTPLRRR